MITISANPSAFFDLTYNSFALLSLFGIVVNAGLIILMVRKGLKVSANRWFTLFLIALVVWGVGEFMGRISADPGASSIWGLLGSPGWIFVSPIFLGFTLTYIGQEDLLNSFAYRFLIFGSGLFFLFLVWSTQLVSIHDPNLFVRRSWGWEAPSASLFPIFLFWLEFQFVLSLGLLFNFYRKGRDLAKKQTQLIIVALLIPLLIGTATDGIAPIIGIKIPGTAIVFTSVMSIIVSYTILKYKLFVINPATFVSNIVATMNEALIVFDRTNSILFVNDAVENFFGYSKSEILGQSLQKFIPSKEGWEKFEATVLEVLKKGSLVKGFETNFLSKAALAIPVSFSGSVLKDPSGTILAFIGIATDIRPIRKLITDVEAERNKLSVALAGIADGVFVVSKEGKILLFNKACEDMLGTSFKDVKEKDIDKLFHFFDAEESLSIKDFFSTKHLTADQVIVSKKDIRIIGPSGKEVFVDLVSSGIAESDLVDLGAIITIHDVSKEKELEEMKLDFVSMAAHELRTPLTSIRGYLSVLQEEVGDKIGKEERSFLDKAFISSSQLAALVENLLSVSRIERGALKVQAESADWASIVKEVYVNFQNLAQEKNIKLSYTPEDNLPPVLVDKFRISEVISNLVANSLQYTRSGGDVEIITKKDKAGVLTQVKDTGQGIPESALPKLFTKFFRVSGVLEQGSKGTGLGLYISKSIIDMHGGKIWVESEMGKGSTFNFIVPFAKEAPRTLGPLPTFSSGRNPAKYSKGKKFIRKPSP